MSVQPNLEDEILAALRKIGRAIDLRSRMLLHSYGLTAPQLSVLKTIARLQPVIASEIAKRVHLGQPTVTGILNRLEQRGLVERTRGARDRRSVLVSLTAAGEAILTGAPSLLQDKFRQRLAELKDWERTQILATLQRVGDMMSELENAPEFDSMIAVLPDVAEAGPRQESEQVPAQVLEAFAESLAPPGTATISDVSPSA